MKRIDLLIYFLIAFHFFVFFNLNNKTFLLILIVSGFILYQQVKNFKIVTWFLYLVTLPFSKGKGFSFTLVSQYMTYQNQPYNFWFTITFADLAMFCLIYFFIRERVINKFSFNKFKTTSTDWLVFAFLLVGFFTIFLSQFQLISFLAFLRLARMIFSYFIVRKIFLNKQLIKPSLIIFASSLIFQGGWATLQFLRQGNLGKDFEQIGEFFSSFGHLTAESPALFRSTGTFVHPNSLASFIGILLPLVFIQLFNPAFNLKHKHFFLLAFFLGGLGLSFTLSRAAWVVIFFIILFTIFFLNKKNMLHFTKQLKTQLIRYLLIVSILLLPLVVIRAVSLHQAFQTYGSAYYRIDLISKAFSLTIKNPLGIGLETFPAAYVQEYGKHFSHPASVHNLFLQISVALGIPGFIIFVVLLIRTYKQFFLNLKKQQPFYLKTAAFFSSLAFLGLGNFYPLFLIPNISEYFWILLSILSL